MTRLRGRGSRRGASASRLGPGRILLALFACLLGPPQRAAFAQDQPPPPAAHPITTITARIAVAAPTHGRRAAVGNDMHAAARLVVADLAPRYPAVDITVTSVDDACSSAPSRPQAEALAASDVDAVIGFPCAASAVTATWVLARAGKLLMTTAPLLPPRESWLAPWPSAKPLTFRLPVAKYGLGEFLGVELMAAAPADARFAIVRDKTKLAQSLAKAVDETLLRHGRPRAALEIFAGGDKTFTAQVARLQALGITHVALIAFPVEGGLLTREIVAAIPDAVVIGTDFLASVETPLIAMPAVRNLRVVLPDTTPFPPESLPPGLAARIAEAGFSATAETQAVAVALSAYVEAASRAGTTEPNAVAAALRDRGDAPGRPRFDAAGRMVVPYWALYRWDEARKLTKAPRN